MRQVLIVGGGYLGKSLTKKFLEKDISVTVTKTNISNVTESSKVLYHELDFTRPSTFSFLVGKQYDLVVLLASSLAGLGTTDLSNKDLDVNVCAFRDFLYFLQCNMISKRYLYTSSMTVYSDLNIPPVQEDACLQPISSYGLSKLMAENIFTFFCNASPEIKGVIVRLPGLYGEDRKNGFIYNVVNRLKQDKIVEVGSKGLGYWEAIHIKDFTTLMILFFERYEWEKNIDIYNFSHGYEIDFYEVAEKIAKILNKEKALSIDYQGKDYKRLYLSNNKLKELLDFEINFDKSLEKYIEGV